MIAGSGIVIDSVLDMHRKCIRAACDHNDLFPLMEPVLVPVGDAAVQFSVIDPQMLFLKCDDVSPVRRNVTSPEGKIAAPSDRFLHQCFRIKGQDRVRGENIDFMILQKCLCDRRDRNFHKFLHLCIQYDDPVIPYEKELPGIIEHIVRFVRYLYFRFPELMPFHQLREILVPLDAIALLLAASASIRFFGQDNDLRAFRLHDVLIPVCALFVNRMVLLIHSKVIKQHSFICKNKDRVINHAEPGRRIPGFRLHDLIIREPVLIAGKDRKEVVGILPVPASEHAEVISVPCGSEVC